MTLREFIEKQNWRFAKNYMAFAPHEYIVKGKCNATNEEFDRFAEIISEHGMRMFYYKMERRYLYFDGWFYWAMRNPDDDMDAVINRCRPDDYDVVFMRKNSWLNSKKAQEYEQLKMELK